MTFIASTPLATLPVTVGAAGVPGGSVASVTVTVISCVAAARRGACPVVTVTWTRYSLLFAALVGEVLARSVGFSKLGALVNLSAPLVLSSVNAAASTPPVIA